MRGTHDTRYRIVDEPRETLLSRLAMPPMVPLLVALLFWPSGMALPVFNSFSLNGPNKWREAAFAFGAVIVHFLVLAGIGLAVRQGLLWHEVTPYLRPLAFVASLWFVVKVYVSQAATHRLRSYLRTLKEGA